MKFWTEVRTVLSKKEEKRGKKTYRLISVGKGRKKGKSERRTMTGKNEQRVGCTH
jgi:hypothetical protein